MPLYIPLLLGTARKDRRTENAARFILAETKKRNEMETELFDVRDFRMPATDDTETTPTALRWREIMERADGLIVVSPEYNHGYPGELKMMLDLVYDSYYRKPMGICGAGGIMGGGRMMEQLRIVAIALKMVPVPFEVYFTHIKERFDEKGVITDSAYHDRVQKFLDEFIWYAQALKTARELKRVPPPANP
jgi:NAD(P)H-dependent FMN reductase